MPKEMLSMVCERNLEEGWLEVVRPRQPTPLANPLGGGGAQASGRGRIGGRLHSAGAAAYAGGGMT